MKLSYGRIKNDGLKLYDPHSVGELRTSPGDGIIISASDSHLYIVPTQLNKDEQIKAFISQYIRSVHPGPYDDLVTDYYLIGSGKNKSIVLCLMHKDALKHYQSQGKPLYYVFQLVKGPGLYTLSLGNGKVEFFDVGINSLDSYETETAPTEAHDICKEGIPLQPVGKFKRPVFSQKKESALIPALATILLTGLLLLSLFDLLSLFQERSVLNNDLAAAREHQKKMIAAANQNTPADDEAPPLLLQVTDIKDSIPRDAYDVLQSIAQRVDREVLISNLVFTEERIDLRGETDNALELVSDLYTTGLFLEIIPNNIQPAPEGNNEKFNITGVLK